MIKKLLLLTPLVAGLLLSSCSDEDFGSNTLKPVPLTTQISFGDILKGKELPSGVKVTLRNLESGSKYEGETDTKGVLSLPSVLPGKYNVEATFTMTAEDYLKYFGESSGSNENVIFNGIAENVTINETSSAIDLELKAASTLGGLVIKQVYYGGSHIKEGALFRDQFVEIYNNSDKVLYADGLMFAQLFGENTAGKLSYNLPNGQLDWSKGVGNTKGDKANTDFVYADYVFKIPGSGTQYPIQPGQSIVIAQTAINHKANYIDETGKDVAIINPELTVDLSRADFEVNLTEFHGSQYRYDIQNPAVPDVDIVYWLANRDMLLDNLGRDAFIIFRATDAEVKSYSKVQSPKGGNTDYYLQIPNSAILDGLDTTGNLDNPVPKKLASSIDAGKTYLTEGAYTSKSVIRKTAKTINGRIVLKDSNNSTEDFVNMKANPKGFAN